MLRPQLVSTCINNIPLVETFKPLIALKHPRLFPTTQTDDQISRDGALAIINAAVIGLFCDNQKVHDWSNQEGRCR
eukprot:5293210-Ditylum_brightwellii.AAC.1